MGMDVSDTLWVDTYEHFEHAPLGKRFESIIHNLLAIITVFCKLILIIYSNYCKPGLSQMEVQINVDHTVWRLTNWHNLQGASSKTSTLCVRMQIGHEYTHVGFELTALIHMYNV
jgi:hypothetical protein